MVRTTYFWDEETDNVLMESDDAGNVTQYTQKPEPYGKVLSQNRNGTKSYYHYDAQGSVRQLTDSTGTVTDSMTYTAFGETVAKTGSTVNPWGYKGAMGYYTNPQTEELYVRARTLAPHLSRWLSTEGVPLLGFVYLDNKPLGQLKAVVKDWFKSSLNVTLLNAPTCSCGETEVKWGLKVPHTVEATQNLPVGGDYLVLQNVCWDENATECAGDCPCSPTDGTIKRSKCVIEKLGIGNLYTGRYPTDIWQIAIDKKFRREGDCRSKGKAITVSEIRVATGSMMAWVEATPRGWIPGATYDGVTVGEHIEGTPAWWNGTEWYWARAFSGMHLEWECCPVENEDAGNMLLLGLSKTWFAGTRKCEE